MQISREDLKPGRVTHEDDDFITIEVGKHDGVEWHVAPLPGDDNPQPVRFLMVLFVHKTDDGKSMEFWTPWEES